MGILAPCTLTFILLAAAGFFTQPIQATDSRKLDETPGSEKCTPCNPTAPPPPPTCPPPPSSPPPKNPPSNYCPPPPSPPSSSIIYITGPPGNLYPVDNDFSGSHSPTAPPALLTCCGLLAMVGMLYGI